MVNYNDFDEKRLGFEGPEPKDIKVKEGEQPKGKYHDLLLTYTYDVYDSEGKIIGTTTEALCIEGPKKVKCRGGIIIGTKEFDGRKVETKSSQFVFDNKNPDHNKFLAVIAIVYNFYVGVIVKFKGKVGLPHFSAQTAMGVLKYPIITKFDKVTGNPVPDADPVMYAKVGKFSPFLDLNKRTLTAETLFETETDTIPLFKFVKIFIGTIVRFQIWLQSSTVTDIKKLVRKPAQGGTIDKYNQDNLNAIEELERKLAQLKAERDNHLSNALEHKSDNKDETKNGTSDPLELPQNLQPSGSSNIMPPMFSIKGLPAIPNLPTIVSTTTSSTT